MRSPWAREYLRRPKDYIWGTEPFRDASGALSSYSVDRS